MTLQPGDRVRMVAEEDGLPRVRYGRVGAVLPGDDRVAVLLDDADEGGGLAVGRAERVAIDTLRLELDGSDLLVEAELRRGLVDLWLAEAARAGLEVRGVHRLGDGVLDGAASYALAEVVADGKSWVLAAFEPPSHAGRVVVAARHPNRWDF